MITYNGKILKKSGFHNAWFVYKGGSAITQYFDYGNTYRLATNTGGNIDLAGTGIISPSEIGYDFTRPFTAIYMETTVTAPTETGMSIKGISLDFGNYYPTIGVGWQNFFNRYPGLYASVTSGGDTKISDIGTDIVKVKFIIENLPNIKRNYYICYYDGNIWGQAVYFDQEWGIISQIALKCVSDRSGALSATNFKGAGFNTFNEASAWMQ